MMLNREHPSKFISAIIPLALFVLRSQASNNFNDIPQFFHQVHSFIHSFYNLSCTEKKQNYLIKHLEPDAILKLCHHALFSQYFMSAPKMHLNKYDKTY